MEIKKAVLTGVKKGTAGYDDYKLYQLKYMRRYRLEHPNSKTKYNQKWEKERNRKLRLLALQRISPELVCSKCGCDRYEILEINHVNGGGNKESRLLYKGKSREFYYAIISGRRNLDDLNLTCKVCNAVHYVELLGINGFDVKYNAPGQIRTDNLRFNRPLLEPIRATEANSEYRI